MNSRIVRASAVAFLCAWFSLLSDRVALAEQPLKANPQTISFKNPIFEGADPWVVKDPHAERFIWCRSGTLKPDSIELGISHSITSIGEVHTIWTAPTTGPYSKELWAPELHFLDGRWYVYFAADDGNNHNHLTYVLESANADPLSEYKLNGPLKTGEGPNADSPNIWAIDMTVLSHSAGRYAIWSGWDAPGTDQQYLYIAKMKSPTELVGRESSYSTTTNIYGNARKRNSNREDSPKVPRYCSTKVERLLVIPRVLRGCQPISLDC